jgi:hypothetical protein
MPKQRPLKLRAWDGERIYYGIRAISFTEDGQLHRFMDAEGVKRVPKALLHRIQRQERARSLRRRCHRREWQGKGHN